MSAGNGSVATAASAAAESQIATAQPNGSGKTKGKKPNRSGKRTAKSKAAAGTRHGRGISKAFPTASFEEAMDLASVIQHNGVTKMRRLTIFETLQKSPDSGPSRTLVTNSSRYGLTVGGYQAEHIELTEIGKAATDPDGNPRDQLKARFTCAVENIEPFKYLYERLANNKLPSEAVLNDLLREYGIPDHDLKQCAEIFIVNAQFLGLLRTIAGAQRLLKIDHVIEETPATVVASTGQPQPVQAAAATTGMPVVSSSEHDDWSRICFYISPIGDEDSEQRRHSDLFLNSIVEPAISETGLKVIRADQIGKPGMIGSQVVEYILRARLVIADLSFHNPNVFYELALRHACGLPTVQIIRKNDKMPFDVQQARTIDIDNTDIYSLIPKLDTIKAKIATQVRSALENPESVDNPIRLFCPGLKVTIPEPARPKAAAAGVKS